MIISHKNKFIFIKTYKTASTSIEIALSSICGPDDVITEVEVDLKTALKMGYTGVQNVYEDYKKYNFKDWARLVLKKKRKFKFRPHSTAKDIKGKVSEEIWNTYFKFSFDRNPWDKALSSYFYQGGDDRWGSFQNFIESGDLSYTKSFDLYAIDGVLAVNKLYRMEDINSALEDVSKHLGLSIPLALPIYKVNSTERKNKKHYREILTPIQKELIEIMYAREIKLLNYKY